MRRRDFAFRYPLAVGVAVGLGSTAAGCDSTPEIQLSRYMIVAKAEIGRMVLSGAIMTPIDMDKPYGRYPRAIFTQDVKWNSEVTLPARVQTDGRGGFGQAFAVDPGEGIAITPELLQRTRTGEARDTLGRSHELYALTETVPVQGGAKELAVAAVFDGTTRPVDYVDSRGTRHTLTPEELTLFGGLVMDVDVDGGNQGRTTLRLRTMQPPQPDPFELAHGA